MFISKTVTIQNHDKFYPLKNVVIFAANIVGKNSWQTYIFKGIGNISFEYET